MVKKFLGDAKIYFIVRGLLAVSWLLTLKIYSHLLIPSDYGLYSVLFFLINIFSIFTTSWIAASYTRFFSEWKDKENVLATISALSTVTIALSCILLFILLLILKEFEILEIGIKLILICSSLYIFLSTYNLIINKLSAERQLRKFAFYSIFQFVTGLLFSSVSLYFTNLGVYGIFIGLLISNILCLLIFLRFDRLPAINVNNINKDIIKTIFKFGSPIFLINVMSNLLTSADLLLLKYYKLDVQAGIYAANYTLSDKSINVIVNIFTVAYLPTLFGIWSEQGSIKAYGFYRKIIYLYLGISLPLLFMLLNYHSFIFSIFLPSNYQNNSIIKFIMIGTYLWSIGLIFSDVITLNKKTLSLALCYILPVIFNIVANLILIPKYGMKASSIISMISYMILSSSILAVAYKTVTKSNENYR